MPGCSGAAAAPPRPRPARRRLVSVGSGAENPPPPPGSLRPSRPCAHGGPSSPAPRRRALTGQRGEAAELSPVLHEAVASGESPPAAASFAAAACQRENMTRAAGGGRRRDLAGLPRASREAARSPPPRPGPRAAAGSAAGKRGARPGRGARPERTAAGEAAAQLRGQEGSRPRGSGARRDKLESNARAGGLSAGTGNTQRQRSHSDRPGVPAVQQQDSGVHRHSPWPRLQEAGVGKRLCRGHQGRCNKSHWCAEERGAQSPRSGKGWSRGSVCSRGGCSSGKTGAGCLH